MIQLNRDATDPKRKQTAEADKSQIDIGQLELILKNHQKNKDKNQMVDDIIN